MVPTPRGDPSCVHIGGDYSLSPCPVVCGCMDRCVGGMGAIVSEGRRSPIVSDVVGRLGRLRWVGARLPARLCCV